MPSWVNWRRGEEVLGLSRSQVDYTRFITLRDYLLNRQPTLLINCAGFTGKPNVDECESRQADTLLGNVALVQTIADACESAGVAWGHISSGCIYSGGKVSMPGQGTRVVKQLMAPEAKLLWQANPAVLRGFSEADLPNFSFREPPCSFYSGSKALAEELLQGRPNHFIWRLRLPFDHEANSRNYLVKIQRYEQVYDNVNSLSHRQDFVRACLELWVRRAPFGIYNMNNPGWLTTRQVMEKLLSAGRLAREIQYFEDDAAFYRVARAPRSNAILDTAKLASVGIEMRSVDEALDDAIGRLSMI